MSLVRISKNFVTSGAVGVVAALVLMRETRIFPSSVLSRTKFGLCFGDNNMKQPLGVNVLFRRFDAAGSPLHACFSYPELVERPTLFSCRYKIPHQDGMNLADVFEHFEAAKAKVSPSPCFTLWVVVAEVAGPSCVSFCGVVVVLAPCSGPC